VLQRALACRPGRRCPTGQKSDRTTIPFYSRLPSKKPWRTFSLAPPSPFQRVISRNSSWFIVLEPFKTPVLIDRKKKQTGN
jgi:hypothetical protein